MNQYSMCNITKELNNQVDLDNDQRWMNDGKGISALPVMLNVTDGSWAVLVKTKANTTMATHYHTKPLFIFTVYGHWHYPEHDWETKAGHFLYEVPGELHTPTFIQDTLLYSVVTGPIIYPQGENKKDIVMDIYSHVNSVKEYYAKIGLGENELKKIMR